MQIPIKCTSTQTLPFQDLHALQGGLKIREKRDIEQLKSSIKEHGFLFPLFIWTAPDGKNHIIAGHGRLQAIAELRAEGYLIDSLPVDFIEAESLEEAKHILLHEVSSYGQLSFDGIMEFTEGLQIDFDEMSLPNFEDMSVSVNEKPSKIKTEEIKPYKRFHVLISYDPSVLPDISDTLSQLLEVLDVPGVEIEQSSN